MKWTTQKRKINELIPWNQNPRQMTEKQNKDLETSLKKFDLVEIPAINIDNTILAGHQRLRIMQMLGRGDEEIDVRVPDRQLTEKEVQEYNIRSNKNTGEWDFDKLANGFEVGELLEWGFDEKELKIEQEVIEDEAPELSDEPAISQLGEVYQLGRHKLMCGDSTKIEDVEKLMNGQKADMVFTDPPYGMDLDTDYSSLNSKPEFVVEKHLKSMRGNTYNKVIGDDKPFNYKDYEWLDCLEQFWWGGDYYAKTLPDNGSWFVWDKRNGNENLDKMFGSQFELCWSKQRHKRELVRVQWAGVFGTEQEFDHKRHHPTQKPIKLSSWFIDKFSEAGQNIIDLFGGSGSTLIACEQTNRTCYIMELDPKYCDVIRKRYAKFIGREEQWQTMTPKI